MSMQTNEVVVPGGETPAPDASATPPVSGQEDWNDLLAGDEDGDFAPEPAPVTPSPSPAVTQPVETPPTPASVTQPPAAPAPTPAPAADTTTPPSPGPAPSPEPQVTQPAQPASPVETPPAPKAPTPEEIAAARSAAISELSKQYTVDNELAARLITEPEVVLPQLLAQAHLNAVAETMRIVQQQIPAWMNQQATVSRAQNDAAERFYSRWPDLKGLPAEKQATVARLLKAYRAENPQATPELMIEEAGAMAMIALKVPFTGGGAQPAAPAAPPAVITPPPAPAGVGATTPLAKPAVTNAFESFAEELLQDDSD